MSSSVRKLAVVALGGAGLVALGLACQGYEFEEVKPTTIAAVHQDVPIVGVQRPPKVFLVVDKSGSMLEPVSGSGDGCAYNASAPCKWNTLKDAFGNSSTGFLAKSIDSNTGKQMASFGLMAFPAGSSGGTCDTGTVVVPLGDNNVTSIRAQLNSIRPVGGTPTASTLKRLLLDTTFMREEPYQARYVLLLTDGQPNCNPNATARCNSCTSSATCNATAGCFPTSPPLDHCSDPNVCLDEDESVTAVKQLAAKGVQTFVIGFGAGTQGGNAERVLNRMADEGGIPNSGAVRYYQANSEADLKAILSKFITMLQSCVFDLNPPPAAKNVLQVILYDKTKGEETTLAEGTDWSYKDEAACFESSSPACAIKLSDARCAEMQNAPPDTFELKFLYASPM